MTATIIVVDDHPVFRQGLCHLLIKEKDLSVVGEADDGQIAIDLVRREAPDLVVMDISMPNLDGIEATRRILAECPDTKIVALSVHSGKQFVRNMMRAGASGYILKESIPEEMIAGIRTVLSGSVYLSKSISNILVSDYKTLISETEPEPQALSSPILQTKLYRPPIAAHIVPRTRLIEMLESGARNAMTLIAGPAGYGKSILASQWLEVSELPGAWLSPDENENDVRVFLSYVLQAIQNVFSDCELGIKSMIGAANLPPVAVTARHLLNDLETVSKRFILVVDDYHRIKNPAIHDFLGELLVHPSPRLHLALLSRRDPQLPLTTLRSRGMLTEITIKDLRFTVSETKFFLERFLRIAIAEKTAQTLEAKTEGWVTGLHLAALSIRNETDQERLSVELPDTSQYQQDYLIQEVLSQVPPQFNRYLLHSAILDRFCAPLCDFLSRDDSQRNDTEAGASGREFVNWLIKTNLFVVALDTENRWFRYHHLFQNLLQNQLKRRCNSGQVSKLHSRAREWFESQGLITDSIEHALAAGDIQAAAQLVERHRYTELDADRWYVVENCLARLPAEVMSQHPGLLLAEEWVAFFRHRLERLPSVLDQVASLLDDQIAEPVLCGELDFFRGYLHYWEGEGKKSRQYFEQALGRMPGNQQLIPGETELHLALARCMTGQKALAIQGLADRIRDTHPTDHVFLTRMIGGLVIIHLLDGDLHRAGLDVQRLHEVAGKGRIRNAGAWASYLRACIHLHAHDLASAAEHFALTLEERFVLDTRAAIDALGGLALAQQLLQQPDNAAATAVRMLEFAQELNDPGCLSVAYSCRARLSLLQGDLAPAVRWAQSFHAAPTSAELFLWLEVPVITRVRVLIAVESEASLREAAGQLAAFRQQSETRRYTCQTIELMVLQSLALEKQGRAGEALAALKEVVALAGPLGWIRPFVEAGPPMADLLNRLEKGKAAAEHIGMILAAFPDTEAILPLPDLRSTKNERGFESKTVAQVQNPKFLDRPLDQSRA